MTISSIRFASESTKRSDLEVKIEQLTATARREALQNFCGKTATKVLADRKLQVYLLFSTSYIAVSAVETQNQ